MNPDIFRKVSLARLSSPEQLDLMLRVTTPKTWIALLALWLILGAAILWGFAGRVATKAEGSGVVIRMGNVMNVATLGGGRVLDIRVNSGDQLTSGQVIATVAQPATLEKIRIAEAQMEDAQRERERVRAVQGSGKQLQLETIKRERANMEQEIQVIQTQHKLVAEQVGVDDQLLAKGLITKQQALGTKQKLIQLDGQVETIRAKMTQLNADQYQVENQGLQTDLQLETRIADLRRNLNALRKELDYTSKVVSPYSGQVLELKVIPGALVSAGTPILSVHPNVKELEAVVYIPARKSKGIEPGMDVELSPTFVKREEFGFIRAKVTTVAEYPATQEAVMRLFENGPLAQSLASEGPVTEVRVQLIEDKTTPSGFRWSSGKGAPIKVTGGMLCSAQIVTRSQRPVSLIFPIIKEKLGLG
jgi:HlyD family secretion protein